MLSSRQVFHHHVLVEELGAADVAALERLRLMTGALVAKGYDAVEVKRKALLLLDGAVNLQAAVLSFADTFWIVAAVFVCTLPLLLLLGRTSRKRAGAAAH